MKSSFLILFSFISLMAFGQQDSQFTKDTCLYAIHFPNDMDKSNKRFDTTIVRDTHCGSHIVILPSCGTEANYSLLPGDSAKYGSPAIFRIEVFTGQQGKMDITKLPKGVYTIWLTADCNGGFVTVRIK